MVIFFFRYLTRDERWMLGMYFKVNEWLVS